MAGGTADVHIMIALEPHRGARIKERRWAEPRTMSAKSWRFLDPPRTEQSTLRNRRSCDGGADV